jgi:hypothetical protein
MPTVVYTNEDMKRITLTFNTYREVKRKMKAFMNDSFDENVNVYRTRRGEWGEWWEHWARIGTKCEIYKQGWQ